MFSQLDLNIVKDSVHSLLCMYVLIILRSLRAYASESRIMFLGSALHRTRLVPAYPILSVSNHAMPVQPDP